MNNPAGIKLSIITATYNAAKHLPRVIDSLAAQTDQDFEWVVADGASTDGTLDLLRTAQQKLRNVVIPNGLDTEVFRPMHRLAVRERLDIPSNKPVVLFGAQSMKDPRKGGIYCAMHCAVLSGHAPCWCLVKGVSSSTRRLMSRCVSWATSLMMRSWLQCILRRISLWVHPAKTISPIP
jgi:glycosyltransferase involved in cell wall biosynthesis